jgi:hypothetical protein
MPKIEELVLAGRYRAVLRAAAAGRCRIGVGYAPVLWVDEMVCADSSAGHRLLAAGLIHPGDPARPRDVVTLTDAGQDALRGPSSPV